MAKYEMHTSGHPVPWDIEHGAAHRELVSMLHVRHGDYAHWGVRLDRASRRITHISAGPIVKSVDFRNEVQARAPSVQPGMIMQRMARFAML